MMSNSVREVTRGTEFQAENTVCARTQSEDMREQCIV